MLATIHSLLCHSQDSFIHINCSNEILDLTLEIFFSSCNKYLECTTILCINGVTLSVLSSATWTCILKWDIYKLWLLSPYTC